MNKKKYFEKMHSVASIVDRLILLEIKKHRLGPVTQMIYSKRKKKIKMRSSIIYLLANYLKKEINDERIYLIPELTNYRLYLSNMILDNKNNMLSNRNRLNSAIIDMHLIDGILMELCYSIKGFISSTEMWRFVSESTYYCHKGQQLEDSLKLSTYTEDNFLDEYYEKSRLMSGIPY